ncbi:MAG: Crp/Fnr family transcriptional regulator [Tenuifilaceae bacterium]|nr:Crp/Fnr family transcriptional regulator [Bacteroidota bacterium]
MINEKFVYTKIKKNELIAENGKVCNRLLFVNKGYVRFFHFDDNGTEITSDFYFAPTFVTTYTSFLTGLPSHVNVQAMCNMEALELSKNDLNELYERHPKFERVGRLIAESVAIHSEEHLFMLLNQPAGVRYRKLLEKYPLYINTIPLQYIASYLGITQETLSRIRKSQL